MKKRLLNYTLLSTSLLLTACGTPSATTAPHPVPSGPQSVHEAPGRSVHITGVPSGVSFTSVDFLNSRLGFVAGSSAYGNPAAGNWLWKTTDGGATWKQLPVHTATALQYIHFSNQEVGWAVRAADCATHGESCRQLDLLRTTDGGRSWTVSAHVAQPTAAKPPSSVVQFPSRNRGYALLGGRLFTTATGGKHWQTISFPSAHYIPQAASFVTANRGWVIGDVVRPAEKQTHTTAPAPALVVFATTNGGRTWHEQYSASSRSHFPIFQQLSLSFVNSNDGWFFYQRTDVFKSALFRTTDGGRHWLPVQQQLFTSRFEPRPIHFVTPEVGWVPVASGAAPFPGLIAITHNAGRTFHTVSNSNMNIWNVSLVSPTDGWAIGNSPGGNGYLLHTTNGGRTFTQVLPTPYPLSEITFINRNSGFGIGTLSNPDAIVRTQDGGTTWQTVGNLPLPAARNIVSMSFVSARQGYLLVMPPDSYVQGAAPTLYETTNGARSFVKVPTQVQTGHTQVLWNGSYLRVFPDGRAIAEMGSFPALHFMTSKNFGRTWTPFASIPQGPGATTYVDFSSPTNGYALVFQGQHTTLYHIGENGTPKQIYRVSGATFALAVSALQSGVVVAVNRATQTSSGVVEFIHSTNGGRTWATAALPTGSALAAALSTSGGVTMTEHAGQLWWATQSGLLESRNAGQTWTWLPSGTMTATR